MSVNRNPWAARLACGYGGTQAFLRHLYWRSFAAAGGLGPLRRLDWSRVDRLVFVCLGNVCRSPYAERRAASQGIVSMSLGLDTTPGIPANDTACTVAAHRGIDLTQHRARRLDDVALAPSDLVVCMEPAHVRAIRRSRTCPAQLTLLGMWASPQRIYLHDPFGGSTEYFHSCYAVIDTAIGALERNLTRHAAMPSPLL